MGAAVGIFSDSHGDLQAFDRAYELLRARGARRFLFTGGRYADLDEWIHWRGEQARGGREYTDADFLADITAWLAHQEQVPRPAAFGDPPGADEDLIRVKQRFVRTPEKESLHYQDANIPRKAMDMLGDTLCCVVYDKNDLSKEDLLNASVFIHGREAEPKVVQIGPRFFVTPGKLTGAAEQTCGLIEVDDRNLKFSAFTLDGATVVDGQVLAVSRSTKLTLK